MKKIVFFIVILFCLVGSRSMAQTTDKRVPLRTSDPHPFVRPQAVVLEVKGGGKGQTAVTSTGASSLRPAAQPGPAQVTLPPLKPGSPAAGAATATVSGANKGIPAGRPVGLQANGASGAKTAQGAAGASAATPPIKTSGSGGTASPN